MTNVDYKDIGFKFVIMSIFNVLNNILIKTKGFLE